MGKVRKIGKMREMGKMGEMGVNAKSSQGGFCTPVRVNYQC